MIHEEEQPIIESLQEEVHPQPVEEPEHYRVVERRSFETEGGVPVEEERIIEWEQPEEGEGYTMATKTTITTTVTKPTEEEEQEGSDTVAEEKPES